MKVFISWSGDRSKAVAEELAVWLPRVVQTIEPWFSPVDIAKGDEWFRKITDALDTVDAGIFVLTPENLGAQWLNFEAGAVRRAIGPEKVCTFLVDLTHTQVTGPFTSFNHTLASDLDDVAKLIDTLRPDAISKDIAREAVETHWNRLDHVVRAQIAVGPPDDAPLVREPEPVTDEILEIVRRIERQMPSSTGPFYEMAPVRGSSRSNREKWEQPFRAFADEFVRTLPIQGLGFRNEGGGVVNVTIGQDPPTVEREIIDQIQELARRHGLLGVALAGPNMSVGIEVELPPVD